MVKKITVREVEGWYNRDGVRWFAVADPRLPDHEPRVVVDRYRGKRGRPYIGCNYCDEGKATLTGYPYARKCRHVWAVRRHLKS